MTDGNETVLGRASGTFTPTGDTRRIPVQVRLCDKQVPPAAPAVLGRCEYYYRPLHGQYVDKSGVSTWQAVKAWATRWNPWDDRVVARRLLQRRDKLIQAETNDGDWSRHASFMVRHIGCGHVPPDYYVSYGYYYCSIYGAKLFPRLSHAGKTWLENARRLLQVNLENGLGDNMFGDEIVVECKRFPGRTSEMHVNKKQLE